MHAWLADPKGARGLTRRLPGELLAAASVFKVFSTSGSLPACGLPGPGGRPAPVVFSVYSDQRQMGLACRAREARVQCALLPSP